MSGLGTPSGGHEPAGHHVGDFRVAWVEASKAAGRPGTIFHDLRRSGVRNLVCAGVSETVAMKVSGHRTSSMFRRYNITSDEDLRLWPSAWA